MHIVQHEIEIPPFLLQETIDAIEGCEVSFPLPSAVRSALHTPEKLSVSQCAADYRTVTAVDAMPGPWRNDLMPHTVEPMDSYALPWVKEIWLCWPERAAKTNVMLNCLAWTKLFNSGNVFWLDPAEHDTGTNVKTKIIPMFKESERLQRCLSPHHDDTGKSLIAFSDGTFLFPAHANSARSMANFFGLHNFGNEVDKYPLMTGAETNPINLIRKRGRDVPGSKYMFSSTPAGRFIYKGTLACRQVKELRSRCPHCGEHILMDDEHLVIPEGTTAEQAENGEADLGYACNHCGAFWDEEDRRQAFMQSRWFCIKGEDVSRPRTIGYHATALPFPMIPLTEYCAKYLRSKTGDLSDKVDYAHGYKVEDFKAALSDRKEDGIIRLRDSRPEGLVPADTFALTMHADTQDNGFWYTVRAWQYGEGLPTSLVKAGFVTTKEALEQVLFAEYRGVGGAGYRMSYSCIDTRGHRTAEIYAWCKRTNTMAFLGAQGRKAQPVTVSKIDVFPGTNKPIPGGLVLYHFDTHYHKDALVLKLQVEPTDPGAWLLHSGYTAEQLELHEKTGAALPPHNLSTYAAHFCAETRDEKGLWQNPTKRANHLWDCEVMAYVLALYLGFQNVKQPDPNAVAAPNGPRIISGGV